jgi:4-amino-4-deoxy-L-arabinose transferase-like glycosyltransferase
MVLPWFIAVQHQNPTFFREFFFEHNLERFATDRYQHDQPFWYYLVVMMLALMPWTVIAVRALIDGVQTSLAEWRLRRSRAGKLLPTRPGDAFPEFLVLWALIPVVFFSFSQSKLPGYILPAIPPITILTGDYLFRRQHGLNRWILLGHATLCGVITTAALLLPWFVVHGRQMPPVRALVAALLAAIGAGLLILIVTKGFGVARLRLATCGIMVVLVLFLYGVGPFFGIPEVAATKRVIHLLDRSYSARPLARRLGDVAPANETVAVFRVHRDIEFGLSFYRNREVANYEIGGVPSYQHILVARMYGRHGADLHTQAALEEYLEGRKYEQLFSWPEQGLDVYLVGSQ